MTKPIQFGLRAAGAAWLFHLLIFGTLAVTGVAFRDLLGGPLARPIFASALAGTVGVLCSLGALIGAVLWSGARGALRSGGTVVTLLGVGLLVFEMIGTEDQLAYEIGAIVSTASAIWWSLSLEADAGRLAQILRSALPWAGVAGVLSLLLGVIPLSLVFMSGQDSGMLLALPIAVMYGGPIWFVCAIVGGLLGVTVWFPRTQLKQ